MDGLHPLNVAALANTKTHANKSSNNDLSNMKVNFFETLNYHVACTPQGCIELLDRYNVTIEGITNM